MEMVMVTCTSQVAVAARDFDDDGQLSEWDQPLNKIHGLLFGVGHDVHVREQRVGACVFQQIERVVVARHYSSSQ